MPWQNNLPGAFSGSGKKLSLLKQPVPVLKKLYFLSLAMILGAVHAFGQQTANKSIAKNNYARAPVDSSRQRDLIDLIVKLFNIKSSDNERKVAHKVSLSVV